MTVGQIDFLDVQPSPQDSSLDTIAELMFGLMMRNMASAGLVFVDPLVLASRSKPGGILASPSYPADRNNPAEQDYVYNWKRDAAIVAMEIAADGVPMDPARAAAHLADYVEFATECQANAALDQAKFTIEAQPFPSWPAQTDGPALQTLSLISAFPKLDAGSEGPARAIADKNTDFLLTVYSDPTTSLWEEVKGYSFFARAVQLRCFEELKSQGYGMKKPANVDNVIASLQSDLVGHWSGNYYLTFSPLADTGSHGVYDPNIDIVMACIYGAIDPTDPKLLATAAKVRGQWADDGSPYQYPIDRADRVLGIGPLLGRYPGDTYDGDGTDPTQGHPWAPCTCNFAQLYYELAKAIIAGAPVPNDPLAQPFLAQIGVDPSTPSTDAVAALRQAGDRMLYAIVYHSDNLQLSEQFDRTTGYEKSVSNLSWSYAAFLSAVRTRKQI
jgi:glucoamylase